MNYTTLYLILAVGGALVPYVFLIGFVQQNGLDVLAFYDAAFATGAAAGLTSDPVIASFVFWAATIELWRRDRGPAPWAFIILTLIIGLAFALALYLLVRHVTRPTVDSAGT